MKSNIAVVGCGYWGKNLVRNFNDLNRLYAVCDVKSKELNVVKKKYPDLVVHDDFDDLLSDSKVEAVVISSPAVTHHRLAKKAILAGKDVLVEKPLAMRYKDGEEIVALAEKKKRILMVGHVLAYHPAVIRLKGMIDSGELGKINYIYSNRLNLGRFRSEENILWSFAPHDISVILSFLNEMPDSVSTTGGNYLNPDVADVTITSLNFLSGVKAHIFVSWLHPYKEQRFVVIGDKKMAVFNDVTLKNKLVTYDHKIDWINRSPFARTEEAVPIDLKEKEPLKAECEHFIECIDTRKLPLTDGNEGLRVLRILEVCQSSLRKNGETVNIGKNIERNYFVHETSKLDEHCEIGEGTKIWHFSHVLKNCKIGKHCVLGQNASIGPNVIIGDNVKIQNNVSVYEGVTLEDDVFCGPSVVFTNVTNPRSHWPRKDEFKPILVKKGASLGANSTILCGITIGQYAFVGAGAVVSKDVPDFALVYGAPARINGWMCFCGVKLALSDSPNSEETAECKNCTRKYKKKGLEVFDAAEKK